MLINVAAIKGETGTGYEPSAGKGPFACNNCEYFRSGDSSCGQKDMFKYSRLPRTNKDARPIVDPEGCCEFVERMGNAFTR
jgi:hypothetical protein